MPEGDGRSTRLRSAQALPRLDTRLLLTIAALEFALHLALSGRYGYWIDELYFIACGRHLDWGYVDHPPAIAVVARTSQLLFGESLFAIRFFPALAMAALALLTGSIARALGGAREAQAIAAVSVCVVPVYTLFGSVLTMNSFEPLLWMACAALTLRIAAGGDARLWLLAGVIAGVGLLNKYSMGFFALALFGGLLLSPQRRLLASPWLWLAAMLALLIASPHALWQYRHGWPTAELLANARLYQHQPVTPLEFVWGQVQIMHPLLLPLWLTGLGWLLFSPRATHFRFLGWTFVLMFAAFLVMQAKNYYLAPVYPLLLAAAGAAIGGTGERRRPLVMGVTIAFLLLAFVPIAPYVLPILPIESVPRYMDLIGIKEVRPEKRAMANVPQIFADMLGWDEVVAEVARVYQRLPAEEQRRALIWGDGYGTAGAVDFLGRKLDLPPAVSGHQNYYLWRAPGQSGDPLIAVGIDAATLRPWCASVETAAEVRCAYCMPDRRVTEVNVCRGLKLPMDEFWPLTKCWTCDRPAFAKTPSS